MFLNLRIKIVFNSCEAERVQALTAKLFVVIDWYYSKCTYQNTDIYTDYYEDIIIIRIVY